MLSAFKRPFIVDTRELSTTASIGFAIYPDDGDETDILMKNADIAMYSVKEGGRNGCRRYDQRMREEVLLNGEDSKVALPEETNRAGRK